MKTRAGLLPLLAASTVLAALAAGGPDPGEALYRVGRQLLGEGKIEAASRKFEEAVAAAPSGSYADDALLAAATIEYAASGIENLGLARPDQIERARVLLSRITKEYRDSDSAPQAAFRLGLLQMDPANHKADLDEAFATFLQVARLYPRSQEAAEAIFAAGSCHLLQGSLASAAGDDAKVVLEYADAPAAARSRFRLAEEAAILGEKPLARLLLSDLRARGDENRTAGATALAARADALDALLAQSAADRPDAPASRTYDPSFVTGGGGQGPVLEIPALATDPEGEIWFLDAATGRAARAAGGTGGRGAQAGPGDPEARGLAIGYAGRVYLWDERTIVLPDGRRFEPRQPAGKGEESEPVKRIAGIALGPLGQIDLLDAAEDRILRYGYDGSIQKVVAKLDARPSALVRWQNELFVLIPSRREIVIIPASGEGETVRIPLKGTGWEISSPITISVDPLGRIYVLDDSARSVTILDHGGRRLGSAAPARGSAGEFRSPTAMAVDGAGSIYVADKRLGRVLRFR